MPNHDTLGMIHAFIDDLGKMGTGDPKIDEWILKLKVLEPITPAMLIEYYGKSRKFDYSDLDRLEKGAYIWNVSLWVSWIGVGLYTASLLFVMTAVQHISILLVWGAFAFQVYACYLMKRKPNGLFLAAIAGFMFFMVAGFLGVPWWATFILWIAGCVGFYKFMEDVSKEESPSGDDRRRARRDGSQDGVDEKIKSVIKWAYETLGCAPQDDEAQIKRKYRELIKQYHPDTIAAKNLPGEFVKFAERKLRDVKDAYDIIRQVRAITD